MRITSLLLAFGLTLATPLWADTALSQMAPTTTPKKPISVVFIQMAEKGSLTAIPNQSNTYLLELKGVPDFIGYFADRPARISGILTTNQFATQWQDNTKPNSFNKIPPNAALSATVFTSPFHKQMRSVPLQLSHPNYNAKNHTMSYTVQVLPGVASANDLKNMKQVALFIDDFCASCVN